MELGSARQGSSCRPPRYTLPHHSVGFTCDFTKGQSLWRAKSVWAERTQPAMLNFQVDDLDKLLAELRAAGVEVDPKQESYDFGRFGWITDPEGNRVELWEPSKL